MPHRRSLLQRSNRFTRCRRIALHCMRLLHRYLPNRRVRFPFNHRKGILRIRQRLRNCLRSPAQSGIPFSMCKQHHQKGWPCPARLIQITGATLLKRPVPAIFRNSQCTMHRPNHPWGLGPLCRHKTAQRPSSKHRSPLPAATEPRKQAPTSSRFPKGGSIPPAPAAPPAPIRPEKKNTGIIVAIAIIAALLVGMGGCAACTAVLSATLDDADDARHAQSDFNQQYQNHNMPINEQELLNRETRTDFGLVGSAALDSAELDSVQSSYFDNASKAPDANGMYAAGVYRVGTDIPAGNYWFSGNKSSLSTFYILQPTSAGASTYDTVHINSYYGHNLMGLTRRRSVHSRQ